MTDEYNLVFTYDIYSGNLYFFTQPRFHFVQINTVIYISNKDFMY